MCPYIVLDFRALPEVFEFGIWSRVSHESQRSLWSEEGTGLDLDLSSPLGSALSCWSSLTSDFI